MLLESTSRVFSIRRDEGDQGILFHHRRQLDDGEILFLVNTSIDSPSSGVIRTTTLGIEQWDLRQARISALSVCRRARRTRVESQLPAAAVRQPAAVPVGQAAGAGAREKGDRDSARSRRPDGDPPHGAERAHAGFRRRHRRRRDEEEPLLLHRRISSPSSKTAWRETRGIEPCSCATS